MNFGFSSGVIYEQIELFEDYNTRLPVDEDEQHFELNYFGLPLGINVGLWRKNSHRLLAHTGLDILFLSSMSIWKSYNDGSIAYDERQFTIHNTLSYYNLGLSYHYFIGKKIFLELNPTARWCLIELCGIHNHYDPEYSRLSLSLDLSLGVKIR